MQGEGALERKGPWAKSGLSSGCQMYFPPPTGSQQHSHRDWTGKRPAEAVIINCSDAGCGGLGFFLRSVQTLMSPEEVNFVSASLAIPIH